MRNKKLIALFSVLIAITLLVVLNSVVFSVQHVRAYCANAEKSQYEEAVLSAHKIKKNENIFFVDKDKVIRNVENSVPYVRVLNVEKKFPNRIYINFVEIIEYFKIYYNDESGAKTCYLANDLSVMSTADGFDTAKKTIRLKVNGDIGNTEAGNTISFESESVKAIVTEVVSAFERLDYYDTIIDVICEIDLTGSVIELSTVAGMKWRILDPSDLTDKLRFALSLYFSDKLTGVQKANGTLTVTGPDSGSYSGPSGGVTL